MPTYCSVAIPRQTLIRATKTAYQCFYRAQDLRCRAFHASRFLHIDDHYSTLGLKRGATTSDIKKSFYKLSKAHHPDRNPQNQQEASKKFVAVSDAYHILGDAKKRERYDAELQQASGGSASASGSYSSARGGSGFSAGGRKASGLSRRRGTFHGPPPSFYKSGGWGANGEKRGANARTDEARWGQQQEGTAGPHRGTTGTWPFSTDPNDVGHFDREGHFKTQSTVEEQLRKGRRKRRGVFEIPENMVDDGGALNAIGKFMMVCGTLAVGLGVPALFMAGGAG